MQKDEFETHNDQSRSDHHKQYKHGKKHHQEDEGQPHNRPRDRQRTTAIALSVITSLFLCVIGYEIIRENAPKHEESLADYEEPRVPLIMSKVSYADKNSHLLHEGDDDDSYENHQIRLLQEHNRKQAAKIKALRQELLEKMQGIHEIKANLFKQEGDPRDKAKIADLNQQLEEKEAHATQLASTMRTMEMDLSMLKRKVEHAEVTQEALAAMIESQREAKEKEHALLKGQIEEMKKVNEVEVASLAEKITELEGALALLDSAYNEKVNALEETNEELARQYDLLDSRTREYQELADQYRQTRESMTQDTLALIAALEWEAASKQRVTDELMTALEKQDIEKSAIIALLEVELQNRNEIIAKKEAEENLQRNEMGFTADEAQEQLLNLVATLEMEMTRASMLQQSLDRSIYVQKQKLNNKEQEISDLEHELKKQHIILNKKGEELENLVSMLKISHDDHHQRMDNLVASHQFESLRVQKLELALAANNDEKEELTAHLKHHQERLSDLMLSNGDLKQRLSDHSEQLVRSGARQQELEDEIAFLKNEAKGKDFLLAARQLELQSLTASYGETTEKLEKEMASLAGQIEVGAIQLAAFEEELQKAHWQNGVHEENLQTLSELEQAKASLKAELAQKEEALEASHRELALLRHSSEQSQSLLKQQVADLTYALDQELVKLAELEGEHLRARATHAQFEEANNKLAQANTRSEDLERELDAAQQTLAQREQEFATLSQTKESAEQSLQEQIENLIAQVAHEQFKAETLHDKFKEKHSQHSEQNKQLQELERQLTLLNDQLLDKEKELLATEEKLLLTLPQLDMLSTENQHLQRSHGVIEAKSQEAAALIQQQQRQINELVERLNEEQRLFKQATARYEQQQRTGLEAAKKGELAALRIALLEDQLAMSNATQQRYEKAISALEQTQVVLKDDHRLELASLKQALENEKERARQFAMQHKNAADENMKRERDGTNLQQALHESNGVIAQLEEELSTLQQALAAKDELLSSKEAEHSNKAQQLNANLQQALEESNHTITQLKEELSTLQRSLAAKDEQLAHQEATQGKTGKHERTTALLEKRLQKEQQRSKEMEADLKKVISAFNAERQKVKALQQRLPIAERN